MTRPSLLAIALLSGCATAEEGVPVASDAAAAVDSSAKIDSTTNPADAANETLAEVSVDSSVDTAVADTTASDAGEEVKPDTAPAPVDAPAGMVALLIANYDGGNFTLTVDTPSTDIRIGLISYEPIELTLVGPYAGNVTAVHYAGYNDAPGTKIIGVDASKVTILKTPAVTLADPPAPSTMVCQYAVAPTSGGCNSKAQAEHYFLGMWGKLTAHVCQYGVYSSTSTSALIAGKKC